MPKAKLATDILAGVGSYTQNTATSPVGLLPFHTVTFRQAAIAAEGRPAIVVRTHLPEQIAVDTASNFDTPYADGVVNVGRKMSTVLQLAGIMPITQSMTAQFWSGSSPIDLSIPLELVAWESHKEITDTVLLLKSMQMPRIDPTTKFLKAPGPRIDLSDDFESQMGNLFGAISGGGSALLDLAKPMVSQAVDSVTSSLGLSGDSNAAAEQGAKQDANANVSSILGSALDTIRQASAAATTAIDQMFKVNGKISVQFGNFLYFDDVIIRNVSDTYNAILGPDGRPQRVSINVTLSTRVTPTYEDLVNGNGKRGIYMVNDPLGGAGSASSTGIVGSVVKTAGNAINKVIGK